MNRGQEQKAERHNGLEVGRYVVLPGFGSQRFFVARAFRGGMGVVYQLLSPQAEMRTSALKTLLAEADPEQFRHECEVWLQLSAHPNVTRAIWYGYLQSGIPAILVDWYPRNLDREIGKSCSPRALASLFAGVAQALMDAYDDLGIIHRDIKPSNILMTDEGMAKVGDWGLASFACRKRALTSTDLWDISSQTMSMERLAGTPAYLAPELLSGNAAQSVATDIYALGVTMYVALVGRHPYLSPGKPPRFDHVRAMSHALDVCGGLNGPYGSILHATGSAMHPDVRRRLPRYSDILAVLQVGESVGARTSVEDGIALARQAQFYRTENRYGEALTLISNWKAVNPESAKPYYEEAQTLVAMGNRGDARKALDAAIKRIGKVANEEGLLVEVVVSMARLEMRGERFKQAEAFMLAAHGHIAAEGRLWWRYPEFAWLALRQGNYKEAYARAKMYLNAYGGSDDLWCWLTLAAYRGSFFASEAPTIGRLLEAGEELGPGGFLCAVLVSGWLPQGQAARLLQRAAQGRSRWRPSARLSRDLMAITFAFPLSQDHEAELAAAIAIQGGVE